MAQIKILAFHFKYLNCAKIEVMLRSQIMSRAEYFLGKKIFLRIFTKKKHIFFMECKLIMTSTCTIRNQSMLYDSLGASDIFVMKMSVISTNLLSHFFLDLTLMIFGEHIKGTSPGKNIFSVISFNLQLKTWIKKFHLLKYLK